MFHWDVWLEIGSNVFLGVLGLAVFVVLALKKHLGKFKITEILQKESSYWIWSLAMIVLCSVIFALAPETKESVKILIGLDLSVGNAFITMGIAIGQLSVKKLNKTDG